VASSNELAFDRTMTAPPGRLTPREHAATQHTMAFAGDAADSPSPSLATGTTVANRYFVRRRLGRGGMGEVYEAQDVALGENVALKTLRLGLSGASVDQFRQEAQLARRVTHVNVCRIHDIGHHEGIDFLTMELLAGETLSARLDRVGRLGTEAAHALLAQLCAGVNAAHEAGIVHRDLKCGNIMIVPGARGERAVITDFGLALMAGVTPGNIAGSPAYMAPEQVEGGEVGPAADLYALGVIMFEMVTGKLPFVGDTAEQTARKRLDTPPPSPRTIAPDVDARWERAIMRCLARAPGERFPDAGAVLAAVTAPARRPTRWRWIVTGVAFASAIGLALLAPVLDGGQRDPVATARAVPGAPPAPPPGPMVITGVAGPVPPTPPMPPMPPRARAEVRAEEEARRAGEDAHRAELQAASEREQAAHERERIARQHGGEPETSADAEHSEAADTEHGDGEHADHADHADTEADPEDKQDQAAERAEAQEAVDDADTQELLARGVRKLGPGRVEIDVNVLQAVARDSDVLVGSTRIETAVKNGKTLGLQLFEIGKGSVLARLGFQNGDIITSLGSVTVGSTGEARKALEGLHDGRHVTIGFLRRGKPQKLDVKLLLPIP
jgi:hypothetical protein